MSRKKRHKHRRKQSRVKCSDITVTYADGSVEVLKANAFHGPPSQRARWRAALRSPHWKKVKREARERDGHKCTVCGGTTILEVHHLTYDRLGEERLEDVAVLCQPCHADEHKRLRKKKRP